MKYFLLALCFAVTSCNKCLECENATSYAEICKGDIAYQSAKENGQISDLQGGAMKCH